MRWVVLVFLTMATAVPVAAGGSDAPSASPEALVTAFLERVGNGEIDTALESLPLCAALAAKTQQLTLLKAQIQTGLSLYGAYLGIEKVRVTDYSPSLLRLVYIMKREQAFLVWNFYFYRPKDEWEVSALAFVDQPAALE